MIEQPTRTDAERLADARNTLSTMVCLAHTVDTRNRDAQGDLASLQGLAGSLLATINLLTTHIGCDREVIEQLDSLHQRIVGLQDVTRRTVRAH